MNYFITDVSDNNIATADVLEEEDDDCLSEGTAGKTLYLDSFIVSIFHY